MTNLKITALSSATTPLVGTEVLPLVQSGGTKKATVNDILTPAAGNGMNFSANTPAAGVTSQLFDGYEEGSWTPVPVPAAGSITSYTSSGSYTLIGRQVTLIFRVTIDNVGTATALSAISGAPFTNGANDAIGCGREGALTGNMWQYKLNGADTNLQGFSYNNNSGIATGYVLFGNLTYFR